MNKYIYVNNYRKMIINFKNHEYLQLYLTVVLVAFQLQNELLRGLNHRMYLSPPLLTRKVMYLVLYVFVRSGYNFSMLILTKITVYLSRPCSSTKVMR